MHYSIFVPSWETTRRSVTTVATVFHLLYFIIFQSLAFSQLPVTLRTVKSANFLPTICKPVGNQIFSSSFAGTKPTGRPSARWPDELNGAVLYGMATVRPNIFNGPSDSPPSRSILLGGKIQVGMTRTSTAFRAWSYSSLSFRRRLV